MATIVTVVSTAAGAGSSRSTLPSLALTPNEVTGDGATTDPIDCVMQWLFYWDCLSKGVRIKKPDCEP
jgi:hypothetical protein